MAYDYARTSTSGGEGFRYETKMTALIALRLFNETPNFFLASNMMLGGKFDDIVFSAQIAQSWETYFIQLKHKQQTSLSKKSITLTDLQYKSKDFNIPKYNESFKSVAKKFWSKTDDPIFDKGLYCSKFVVYTNATFHPEVLNDKCHFVKGSNLLSTADKEGVVLQFDSKSQVFKNFANNLEIDHFVHKLVFYSSQSNENEIDDIILIELKKALCGKSLEQSALKFLAYEWINYIQRRLGSSDNTTRYLVRLEVQNVLKRISGNAEFGRKREISIQFLDSFLKSVYGQLASEKLLYFVSHVDTTAVCLAALSQLGLSAEPNSVVTIQNIIDDRSIITRKWFDANDMTLVIDCEVDTLNVDVEQVSQFLKHIKTMNETNRIILVATNANMTAKTLSLSIGAKKKKFNCSMKNLNEDSKKMLKEREVFFQGYKILLEGIMPQSQALDDVFDLSAITQLVQGRQLDVGLKPVDEKSYYVTRVLIRQVNVHLEALSRAELQGCIVLSGISQEEALPYLNHLHHLSFYDIISSPGLDINRTIVFLNDLNSDKQFEALEKTFQSSLHWFEKSKKSWTWKRSTSKIEDVIKHILNQYEYVPTDNIMKIKDKMVVVVAEPGMGKSTLLEHLASETKRQCPHIWVILVPLHDYISALESSDFVNKAEECTKQVLALAAGIDSQTNKFNERLFNQCYENGNMIVLLDGFDEITPQFTQQGLAMIKVLKESAVSRVWISARPVVMELLEKATCTISYSIKPFSDKDQKTFLKKFWKTQIPLIQQEKLEAFVAKLLTSLSKSFDNKLNQFTGIPLQTLMIAEIFQENLNTYHSSGVVELKEKLNGLELFAEFVRIKQRNYLQKSKIGNTLSHDDIKELENLREKELISMALLTLLPISVCESLVPAVSKNDRDLLRVKVTEGREKMGIVLSFNKDCPQFIHRTFAEYFAALFFSKNYATNRKFLSSDMFFSKAFEFVKYFFDRLLCGNNVLHTAVLDNDTDKITELLSRHFNVNEIDMAGRTALHVAASLSDSEHLLRLLLENGADPKIEDNILKWCPIKYAMKNGCVDNIAPLLDRTNDALDLGIIPVNWKVLLKAVTGDYLQLFLFLLDNGICEQECLDVLSPQNWLGDNISDSLTILHLAAYYGSENIMKYLLRKDSRDSKLMLLESIDEHGFTPLILAASRSHFGCANILLDSGANGLATDGLGANLCQYAAQAQDLQLLCAALGDATNRKADPQTYLQGTLTLLVSDNSDWGASTLDLILSFCPELANGKTSKGMSPLVLAAIKGNEKAIRTLKAFNANVNEVSQYGTSLHLATLGGHNDAVRELLAFPNIDVEICDDNGYTALYVATSKGKVNIYKLLVNAGANVNFCTNEGNNLAHAVADVFSQNTEIFIDLQARGIDFWKENSKGETGFSLLKQYGGSKLLAALDPTCVVPQSEDTKVVNNKKTRKKENVNKTKAAPETVNSLNDLQIGSVSADNTEVLLKVQNLVKLAIEKKKTDSQPCSSMKPADNTKKTSLEESAEAKAELVLKIQNSLNSIIKNQKTKLNENSRNSNLGPSSSRTPKTLSLPKPLMELSGAGNQIRGLNQIQNYRSSYGRNDKYSLENSSGGNSQRNPQYTRQNSDQSTKSIESRFQGRTNGATKSDQINSYQKKRQQNEFRPSHSFSHENQRPDSRGSDSHMNVAGHVRRNRSKSRTNFSQTQPANHFQNIGRSGPHQSGGKNPPPNPNQRDSPAANHNQHYNQHRNYNSGNWQHQNPFFPLDFGNTSNPRFYGPVNHPFPNMQNYINPNQPAGYFPPNNHFMSGPWPNQQAYSGQNNQPLGSQSNQYYRPNSEQCHNSRQNNRRDSNIQHTRSKSRQGHSRNNTKKE